ncbi:MAG: DUF1338 domain-containing protein [Lentisphaeraceae bacterium]|nr:DUF1338 domain-containing protein [Lentisphaeraceae bacterium]
MSKIELFDKLWSQYSSTNIQAAQIHSLLRERGENVENDHIALRTYGLPGIRVEDLASFFEPYGYVEKGSYDFELKKLRAKHYEKEGFPRVFISELRVDEFSQDLQCVVKSLVGQIPVEVVKDESLLYSGPQWSKVSYETYERLREESEYAAWMSVFGFVANHFTVSVNKLTSFSDIVELNTFLKERDFKLNISGGEVKGTIGDCLLQSSTLASEVRVKFLDGEYLVPGCYYEFAERFPLASGELFNGFVTSSADKIFESTDVQK